MPYYINYNVLLQKYDIVEMTKIRYKKMTQVPVSKISIFLC